MLGDRIVLEGELELLTDLHIGSGEERETGPDDEQPLYRLVVRDADGRPYLPSTSLKGALRAAAPLDEAERADLFGQISDHERELGRIGWLWLDGGRLLDPRPESARFRTVARDRGTTEDGYVRTRVRLDRQTGAAEERLLHNAEMVGRGARFSWRATWFLADAHELGEEALERLARALAPLASGLCLGRGGRQGDGRIRLDAATLVTRRRHLREEDGILDEDNDAGLARDLARRLAACELPEAPLRRLRLACDGPFISMRERQRGRGERGEAPRVLEPLELDGVPVLWPSSLLGALRARAAWVTECARLRPAADGGGPDRFAPGRGSGEADDRDLAHALGGRRAVIGADDVRRLSSVERLFGVAGWRGEVEVRELRWASSVTRSQTMTSVSIDRFTGGGRDGLLFTTRTILGACFDATLAFDDRAARLLGDEATRADHELLDLLVEDLVRQGVFLGHGAGKGFGWFEVEETTP